MRVSSINSVSLFKGANDSNNPVETKMKKPMNPASATGYLTLGLFGTSIITGMNKKMKLHKAACYLAVASAIGHVASINMHKNHHLQQKNV